MLSQAIVRLLNDNNKVFYGHFLQAARRIPDPKLPAPAGINITDGINLYYNPTLWVKFTLSEQAAILEHEVLHIVFDHVLGRVGDKDKKLWNIAADAVVNQYISGLPAGCVYPKTYGLPNGENAEWYYAKLKQMFPPDKQPGQGTLDDHGKWEESNANANPEGAKALVRDALQMAKNRSCGNMPGHISELLDKYGQSVVNWKTVLRQFVYASINAAKKKTRKRSNRRYGLIYPGKRKDQYAHIAVLQDVSGSVSDESIKQYYAELGAMCRALPIKVTVVEADCEVTQVFEFDPKKPVTIKGRGGTAYQPAFDKATELDVDAAIYMGDMDTSDTPTKPRYPVLWATVQGGKPPVTWGKRVKIT